MLSVTENPLHTHRPPLERRNFIGISLVSYEKRRKRENFPRSKQTLDMQTMDPIWISSHAKWVEIKLQHRNRQH